jgi:hypothetical protein
MPPLSSRCESPEAGFTLTELTISLFVVVAILGGVLALFDFSNRISRVQTSVSDMQQSLRTAQSDLEPLLRMVGRGGLPFRNAAPGGAVWVVDNVAPGTTIGGAGTPQVVEGSDVLVVRGVFSSPLYQVNAKDTSTFILRDAGGSVTEDPLQAVGGTLTIRALSPTGIPQSLQALATAVEGNVPEALLVVSANNAGTFAVVELVPGSSNVDVDDQATLDFRITGGVNTMQYAQLSPGGAFPAGLTSAGYVGILEEHQLYVRSLPAGRNSTSALSRARVFPNTQEAYGPGGPGNVANWINDVADNILDQQIALGLDTVNHVPRPRPPTAPPEPPGLTSIEADPVNGYISEGANGVNDDWLLNAAADNPANPVWADSLLYYVRVTLLGRTGRRDPKYEAPVLARLENRLYAPTHPFNLSRLNGGTERMYRRRILQTVVNVRNL